jgi:hypothetical protein
MRSAFLCRGFMLRNSRAMKIPAGRKRRRLVSDQRRKYFTCCFLKFLLQ